MRETSSALSIRSLAGLTHFEDARRLQLELVEQRIREEIPDTVLFLEHYPVITRGRGLQWTGEARERHSPLLMPIPPGVEYADCERGGDLTYHGPGQLVIYPILKINDLNGYLRAIENWLIAFLKAQGLAARSEPKASGVWVGEKKIASLGVAVKKWVTYHGIAINIVNDLTPFSLISPCGFNPEVMANLKTLLPGKPELEGGIDGPWRAWVERELRNLGAII